MGLNDFKARKTYVNISDGAIRINCSSDNVNAKKRITKDGNEKFELVYQSISGKITGIQKHRSDYGNFINFDISTDGVDYVLQAKDDSKYCQCILMCLPNINFEKDVTIQPYAIPQKDKAGKVITGTDGKAKKNTGCVIYQNNTKIVNFYVTSNKVNDKFVKIYSNNFPKPTSADMDSDDYKIYNLSIKKFLLDQLEKVILPKLQNAKMSVPVVLNDDPFADDEQAPF
jgi:hypothetical protein